MSVLIVCLGCWLAGAAIVLAIVFSFRTRKKLTEWGKAMPPVPWWAIVGVFGLALAWPLLILAAIAEPLIRRRRSRR